MPIFAIIFGNLLAGVLVYLLGREYRDPFMADSRVFFGRMIMAVAFALVVFNVYMLSLL